MEPTQSEALNTTEITPALETIGARPVPAGTRVFMHTEQNVTHPTMHALMGAIACKHQLSPGAAYSSGAVAYIKPGDYFNAHSIIANIGEAIAHQFGRHAAENTSIKSDKLVELESMIKQWLNENVDLAFFNLTDIQQHTVTEQDISDFVAGIGTEEDAHA